MNWLKLGALMNGPSVSLCVEDSRNTIGDSDVKLKLKLHVYFGVSYLFKLEYSFADVFHSYSLSCITYLGITCDTIISFQKVFITTSSYWTYSNTILTSVLGGMLPILIFNTSNDKSSIYP